MIVGLPKEIKTEEYRVGLTPAAVKAFTSRGHAVLVEEGAGVGSGFEDSEYAAAGAEITADKLGSFLLLENYHHWSGLHRQGQRTEKLEKKISGSIDQLREYHTAVISAVVTGKIDIRKEVP